MSTETLDAQIKTRLPKAVKEAFEQIARDRHLDAADIYRQALREYLQRNQPGQVELPIANGEAQPA